MSHFYKLFVYNNSESKNEIFIIRISMYISKIRNTVAE